MSNEVFKKIDEVRGYDNIKQHIKADGLVFRLFYLSIELFGCTPWELADRISENQLTWMLAYTEVKADIEREAIEKARSKK